MQICILGEVLIRLNLGKAEDIRLSVWINCKVVPSFIMNFISLFTENWFITVFY